MQRIPEKDEKPEDNQFYARDDKNEGTLYYNGTLDQPADAVFLKVYADDKPFKTETRQLAADKRYAFTVKLKPGLIKYRVEFGTQTGGQEKVLHTAAQPGLRRRLSDRRPIQRLGHRYRRESPRDTSDWIRSYAGPTGRGDGTDWVRDRLNEAVRAISRGRTSGAYPVWKAGPNDKAELGYWGMELAKRLVASREDADLHD